MIVQSFRMRDFRILYGPQHGTYADEDGTGVSHPANLQPDAHRVMHYTAPDAFGVQVGLGMLFSEGMIAEDHAVRVDLKMEDGSWLEYDPESHIDGSVQHQGHHRTQSDGLGQSTTPRKRRVRPAVRLSANDALRRKLD